MNLDLKNTNWKNIEKGAKKYLVIMESVSDPSVNLQTDVSFQREFNGFYRIRQRPRFFYEVLYDYLERNKTKKVFFKQTLAFFHHKIQRFEPSFSSKVVATIDPNFPVWDSVVLARLGLKKPNDSNTEIRFEKMVKTYDDIVKWYAEFLNTKQAKNMVKIFDQKIGVLNITDIKKIDLILWQTRM